MGNIKFMSSTFFFYIFSYCLSSQNFEYNSDNLKYIYKNKLNQEIISNTREEEKTFKDYSIKRIRSPTTHCIHAKDESPKNINSKSLDLKSYTRCLGFDRLTSRITVECSMTVSQLLLECKKYGVIPKVLPEFKDITVGGAIVGSAIESSSWKYGQFNDICSNILVIQDDGNLVNCDNSKSEKDLWRYLSGSYGTLGLFL